MRNLKLLFAAALMLLVIAGCGSQNSVGSQSLLNFTPAPSPRAVPSPSPSNGPGGAGGHPSPVAQHSTAPPAVTVVVTIPSSTGANQSMSPSPLTINAGTIVKWVNGDSQPRGVAANNGTFKSPLIPPGGSWTYTFTAPGTFDYSDTTRPYVTGEVVVR